MVENKKTQNFKSSGNIIVDQVGQMGITGNIVNPNWNYYVTNESGKTNYLAVQILAEIVYWYRPSIKENKTTGISEFEKRFKHDKYLQRSYYQLEENYNCSNLSDKDISYIINVAQSDFNKITKAHKVLINYKKPINSFMGFLRDAILNNWEPDINSTTISTSSGTNDYYKRCGYSSWEELEKAWVDKCNK